MGMSVRVERPVAAFLRQVAFFHLLDRLVEVGPQLISHLVAHAAGPAGPAARGVLVPLGPGARVEVAGGARAGAPDGDARDEARQPPAVAMLAARLERRADAADEDAGALPAGLAAILVNGDRVLRMLGGRRE